MSNRITAAPCRVYVGDVRQGPGALEWYVMQSERGRSGDRRTMYVVGRKNAEGIITAQETRSRATVIAWPLLRRSKIRPIEGTAPPGTPAMREVQS